MLDLILYNGIIVTSLGQYRADLGIQGGKIVAISQDLSSSRSSGVIHLDGKCILPGCIDSHIHLWEAGMRAAPDFRDGTRASAAGGITTIIAQPLMVPELLNRDVFMAAVALGEKTSYTDFALHAGVGIDNLNDLEGMWEAGCTAFKIFMCESGSKVAGLSDGQILDAFRLIGSMGGTAILHCENEALLCHNRKKLEAQGRKDPGAFFEWRTPLVESEAIHRALFLLKGTGAKAVILHTTVPEGVEMVAEARADGMDVWVETCPHNLYLTEQDLLEKGPWITFAPPVRDSCRVDHLWQHLKQGNIHVVASDHNPMDPRVKETGVANIWNCMFGVPDTETLVPLMLHAVSEGRLSLEQLVLLMSENPAKIYGLYPRKGTIQIGSDADFTVVDLARTTTLKAEEMQTSCGWIPYEGKEIRGGVAYSILRGDIIAKDGKLLGKAGEGKFIPRAS